MHAIILYLLIDIVFFYYFYYHCYYYFVFLPSFFFPMLCFPLLSFPSLFFSFSSNRPAYYKLIEECVSQIVLHRSGCDPDFSATKRFQIDVQPLIDTLVEKSRAEEERRLVEVSQKLEEAIASKQEAEAKLQHAENKIRELEQGGARSTGVNAVSLSLNSLSRINADFCF